MISGSGEEVAVEPERRDAYIECEECDSVSFFVGIGSPHPLSHKRMGGGGGVGSLFRRPARNSGTLYTLCAELSFFMEENTYITLKRQDKDDLFYRNIVHGHQENLIVV